MDTSHELVLWQALYSLEAKYWRDVDFNGGRSAHEFFAPDGLMVVGHNRFEGREKIREFYEWRARQIVEGVSGVMTTRHLVANFYVASNSERCATVLGIVTFYGGAATELKRQSRPPMLLADLVNECVLSTDNAWQFKSHTLRPVFLGHEMPPSMAVDTHWLGRH